MTHAQNQIIEFNAVSTLSISAWGEKKREKERNESERRAKKERK